MLTSLITILGILLGFSLTIFVHELGHFLLARRAGVRVEVFCIGIGPRMVKLYTDKSGTEYILAWLPLGGYVKMKGQEDMPGAAPTDAGTDSYLAKTPLQKLSIISAGVVMNVIFSYILLVIAFSVGVPFGSNKIAGIQQGFVSGNAGFLPGDEIIKIGTRSVESWEDILTAQAFLDENKPVNIRVKRGDKELTLVTKAQKEEFAGGGEKISIPDFGFIPERLARVAELDPTSPAYAAGLREGMDILGIELEGESGHFKSMEGIERAIQIHPGSKARLFVSAGSGEKAAASNAVREIAMTIPADLVPDKGYFTTAVVDPVAGAAAEKAGLKNGDLITRIQGTPVRGYEDVIAYFQKLKTDAPVQLTIRRSNEEQILTVVPRYFVAGERYAIGVRPSTQKAALAQSVSHTEDWMKAVRGGIRLGDQITEAQTRDGFVEYKLIRNGEKLTLKLPITELQKKKVGKICRFSLREKLIRYPVQESLWKAFPRVKTELEEVYLFLGRLFAGKMSVDMIGGPIRIFEVTYIVGTIKGFGYFLLLFAKIGFTLAVINFLPFPVLDGGHAVFLVYEIIFRKPAPAALVRILHTLGFVALILLFAFVITNDLRSLITRLF